MNEKELRHINFNNLCSCLDRSVLPAVFYNYG